MTNQQPSTEQLEWMHDFCENMWDIQMQTCCQEHRLYPNDPNYPDLSDPEEQRSILVDGTFASLVMDFLHDADFEEEDATKNWDKEFICDEMAILLNDMENHPDDVLAMYGVEVAVRSQ